MPRTHQVVIDLEENTARRGSQMSVPPDSTSPDQLIADLHRQLAERTAERDEALARETATAEVLQVINSSPGNLSPVFETILEKAHALCGVEYGSLQLYDGRCFRGVAQRGLPPALAELARQPYEPTPQDALTRLVAGERFAASEVPDQFEHVKLVSGRIRAAADAGIRTLLFVPLRRERLLLGAIT